MIFLDTHVAAWLFAGDLKLLSPKGRERLTKDELWLSPMVGLELQFLFEIGRTTRPASEVLIFLQDHLAVAVCHVPFSQVTAEACLLEWTRDPFDRLIVAHAKIHSAPLLTRDRSIREHYAGAVW